MIIRVGYNTLFIILATAIFSILLLTRQIELSSLLDQRIEAPHSNIWVEDYWHRPGVSKWRNATTITFGNDVRRRLCDNLIGFGLLARLEETKRPICSAKEESLKANKSPTSSTTRMNGFRLPYFTGMHMSGYDRKLSLVEVDNLQFTFGKQPNQGCKWQHRVHFKCKPNIQYLNEESELPLFDYLRSDCSNFEVQEYKCKGSNRDITTAVFLFRDDIYNVFHHHSDFINLFLVYQLFGLSTDSTQIVVLDSYPISSPLDPLYTSFTDHPVLYASQNYPTIASLERYGIGANETRSEHNSSMVATVCFDKAIFGIHGWLGFHWQPKFKEQSVDLDCDRSDLMQAYSSFVLGGLNLLNTPLPGLQTDGTIRPQITILSRKSKPNKIVDRQIDNEEELVEWLRHASRNSVDITLIDLGTLPSFIDQIKVIRKTNILVGMHGAALTNIVYLPRHAVVVELFPLQFRKSKLFKTLTRYMGLTYFSWRNPFPSREVVDKGFF